MIESLFFKVLLLFMFTLHDSFFLIFKVKAKTVAHLRAKKYLT